MAEYYFDEATHYGTLPGWDEKWYPNEEAYKQAYRDEENEIVDALAELEAERIIDYPEDYRYFD